MRTKVAPKKVAVEESSGNVFKDIGHPNPDEALAKAKLAIHLGKIVEKRGWTQEEAATLMRIDQPKVSKILRGQLREFSVERLLGFLRLVGCDVEIVLKTGARMPAKFRVVERAQA